MDRASTRGKEPDLVGPPTMLEQVVTLLSWLWLHPTEQGSTHPKKLFNSKVHEGCSRPRLAGKRKARTRGATTWLSIGGPVSVLHAVERGRRTIKQAAGKLCGLVVVRRANQTHRMHPCTKRYVVAWEGWKTTVVVTVHDKMSHLWHRGAGGG